jgi:predicted nucleic acid-binding protein
MRFWDSSALVPIVVREPNTPSVRALLESDPEVVLWWAARVECESAVARQRREGLLSSEGEAQARRVLERFFQVAGEVPATDRVRDSAIRLLRVHTLRAADALHLAAALTWADGPPAGRELVTFDERLADAASREGFSVRGPGSAPAPL